MWLCCVYSAADRHDISSRLVDYFDKKEAAAGAGDDMRSKTTQQNVQLSPLYASRPLVTTAPEVRGPQ